MSDKKKKSVKRRPKTIVARDLMSVTGGAGFGSAINPQGGSDPFVAGLAPQGPRNPFNPQRPPLGPTIGYNPTGPNSPFPFGNNQR